MAEGKGLEEELLEAFARAFAAVHRMRMDRLLAEKLTMPQLKVLAVIARAASAASGRGPTVGDLARRLHLSAPTVTGIVDRLNAAGLVERTRLAADRRVVEVVATEAGRRLLADVFAAREERLRRAIARMDEDDAQALLRGLRAFAETVSADNGNGGAADNRDGGTADSRDGGTNGGSNGTA